MRSGFFPESAIRNPLIVQVVKVAVDWKKSANAAVRGVRFKPRLFRTSDARPGLIEAA